MRLIRFFIYSSATLLLLTAGAKFAGVMGHEKILAAHDPVFGLTIEQLILVVALMESGVAITCFITRQIWVPATLIAWLSTNILGYRLVRIMMGYHKPCDCLGHITDALHIPPRFAEIAMEVILAYLLVGSYMTLIWLWRQPKQLPGSACV